MTEQDRAQLFFLVLKLARNRSHQRDRVRRGVMSEQQFAESMARDEARLDEFLKEKTCGNT